MQRSKKFLLPGLSALLILMAQACGKKDTDFGGTAPVIPKDSLVKPDTSKTLDTLRFATLNMSIGFPVSQLLFTNMADQPTAYKVLDSLFKRYQRTMPKERIKGMAKAIADLKLDVVGLQEVMSFTKDGNLVDDYLPELLQAIRDAGGPAYKFYSNPLNDTLLQGAMDGTVLKIAFHEGNALLVKPELAILDSARFLYFTLLKIPTGENAVTQRCLSYLKIKSPNGVVWQVYNTHLEVFEDISSSQALEVRRIVDSLKLRDSAGQETAPQIVMGDFNVLPNTDAHTVMQEGGFSDTFDTTAADPGFTCCIAASALWDTQAAFSNRRIDFIFSRHIVKVLEHHVALKDSLTTSTGVGLLATDHRAVWARIVGQ
ncbi:MAG: endonuclease/exonuclease/phosphatase family protein [Fibrobacteria bacterium]